MKNLISIIIYFRKVINNLISLFIKFILRLLGAKIGKGTFISLSSMIISPNIQIGRDCKILNGVFIYAKRVSIGIGCIISEGVFISGDDQITIGDGSYLGKNVRINLGRSVNIGKDVGIGEETIIWTHGYWHPADECFPVVYEPVSIKDRAWVSSNITILPGITIGERATVGAGAVVTKDVPDGKVVAGNPAKIIKNTDNLRKEMPFIDIIKNILNEYDRENLIKYREFDDHLLFIYEKYYIYVIDSHNFNINVLHNNKMKIILYKSFPSELEEIFKNNFWFDFNNKVRRRTNRTEIVNLHDYFRKFGIRFLIEE